MAQKMVCCCFHTIVQERYSDESKSEVRGLKKMFGYRSNVPKVRLTTDRLVVRPVHDRDAASGRLLRRK